MKSLNRSYAVFVIVAGWISIAACTPKFLTPSEIEAVETATNAYRAYAGRDCATVGRLTEEDALDVWEFNEVRHSMQLLRGFCHEIEGDIGEARNVYRRLVVEAPNSFAADDAAERIRVLRISEADPDYVLWMAAASHRINRSRPRRTPINRTAVQFPPLARVIGVEGFTIVEFGVTRRGETENPVVVDSSPPLLFDGASIRAIRRWKYQRASNSDPNDRQLIRLLFKPNGAAEPDETLPESTLSDPAAESN